MTRVMIASRQRGPAPSFFVRHASKAMVRLTIKCSLLFDLRSVTANPDKTNRCRSPTWTYAVLPIVTVIPMGMIMVAVMIVVMVMIIIVRVMFMIVIVIMPLIVTLLPMTLLLIVILLMTLLLIL